MNHQDLESIIKNYPEVELIISDVATPTSEIAAQVLGVDSGQIVKTLIIKTDKNKFVALILAGNRKLDRNKVTKTLGCKKFRFATPEETLEQSGYPPGGVSPVGLSKTIDKVIIDKAACSYDVVFGGGGSNKSLLKIPVQLIILLNQADVDDISLE